jgi:hypothetical protein
MEAQYLKAQSGTIEVHRRLMEAYSRDIDLERSTKRPAYLRDLKLTLQLWMPKVSFWIFGGSF